MLPESWGDCTGAAEFLRVRGVAAFRAVLKERVHAFAFRALAILSRYRPRAGWSEASRHAAWKAAIEFYATTARDRSADLDAHFVPTIVAGLSRSWETFEPIGVVDIEATDRPAPEPTGPQDHNASPAAAPPPCPLNAPPADATPEVPDASEQPAGAAAPQQPAETESAKSDGSSVSTRADGACQHHGCNREVCFCFD